MSLPADLQSETNPVPEFETDPTGDAVVIEELPAFELALIQGHTEHEH